MNKFLRFMTFKIRYLHKLRHKIVFFFLVQVIKKHFSLLSRIFLIICSSAVRVAARNFSVFFV
jgi:hypothetical protein